MADAGDEMPGRRAQRLAGHAKPHGGDTRGPRGPCDLGEWPRSRSALARAAAERGQGRERLHAWRNASGAFLSEAEDAGRELMT